MRRGWLGLVDRATGRRRYGGAARDEAGDTLIEILIAIVILGIASVALLVAFAASISASAVHRSIATFDTVLRSATQQAISQIQQQPDPLYVSCAYTSTYQTGPNQVVFSLPPTYSASVSQVQYWNGTTFTTNHAQCIANSPQWITIVVKNNVTGQQFPSNFIVDDPYAPPVPVGGPAYQLVFVQQPSGADAGTAFGTQPAIAIEDASGNVVTTDLSPVTLTITTGTGTSGAVLSQYCTGVENSGVVTFSGCSINLAGLNYQLTATDPGSGGGVLVPAVSTSFNVYTQLVQPVITSLIPSTTEAGAVNVTFTGSSNAPGGETYTVTACANAGVGFGCVTQNNFTSGSDLTGLTPGTGYYVTVTANAPTPLYLPATSATAGPAQATVQLNAPGTPTLAYGTVAGSVAVSFSTPTPAATGQAYTATACTNAAMSTGCVSGSVTPGGNLTGLAYGAGSPGTSYFVRVVAAASSGFLVSPASGVSATSQAAISQLNPPTGFSTAPSATQAGAITLTFTASAGPQAPASYTASICKNAAMTAGCTTQTVNPGTSQLTGLTQGTTYYVQIIANAPSSGYLTASTSVAPGVVATTQLSSPSAVSLAYGTVAGSVNVTFTAPGNAAPGQTYTALACTNAGMTTGCVSNATITSGSNLTGLAYTAGSPGTTYFVTVTSNASTGYFASSPTAAQSQAATSKLNSPGTPTAVTSTSNAGAIIITFTGSSGTAPTSYTATACTNSSMTSGCLTAPITSGGTMTGLSQGSSYWVTITANPPVGFVSATSPVSTSPTGASTQLNAPTITSVASSATTAGQLSISYTGSSNAPGGQTYTATACTDAAMTMNCVSHASFTSGSQFTGLTPGSLYYVTITAVASGSYLAATSSVVGPTLATVQLATPGAPTLGYGTVAGSISVTATTSNGPAGQLYTVKACTNAGMTTGCVTTTNVLSGGNATGLAYTQGSPGTPYYATVTAQASSGYLGSGTSLAGGPQADTSLLNPPGTPTTASSTTTAGAITATFTNSTGPTVAGYSATACTNAGMTTGCVTQGGYTSGAQLTGLVQGTKYYATITALSSSAAYAASTSGVSASSVLATVQLATPTITSVAPSTTTAGQLTITYTGSSNAPGGQLYTAIACTDAAMTTGCVTQANYASGAQFVGLTAGSMYYVTITAVASSGYLTVTTSSVGPTMATVQLATPGTPVLAYGTVAGSIAVTASSANAPAGQLFSVKACTNAAMSTGCVTVANVLSGGNATGLAYTTGSAGTPYYVTVTAQASSGYLGSGTSGVAGPQADTSQLAAPTGLTTAPSTTTSGAITATFTASAGVAPSSYTATVCTNAAMTTGCVTFPNDTSGAQLTGLTPATAYYTTITAVSTSAAYVSSTTAVSGPTLAATQLTAPTGVSLAYGTVAGSIAVTFTGSSNAPGGETYTATACTNAAMTTACVSNAAATSGANLTGLAYVQGAAGTAYYVTVTANPSTGYLVSPASSVVGPQNATSQLGTPGTPVVASSTTVASAITATFTASSGVAPSSYTAKACTNAAMTTGCLSQANYTSGSQIFALTEDVSYYVTITAVSTSTAFVGATSPVSSSSALATTQLATPTINSVAPSSTTVGAITIAYTGSTNAPSGQIYTATACTDVAMTQSCITDPGYVSGSQLTGLGAATAYYVTITAGASPGYLAATTAVVGPTLATIQLSTPTTPILAYGATAGSINFTSSSVNSPAGQLFTVKACTNAAMTTGCVTSAAVTSGTDVGSLAYTQGSPGTPYYVSVTAAASSGYLASPASAVAGPQADTSKIGTPGTPVVAPSTTTVGAITATFTASPGTTPASYTAVACTNAAMSTGCVTETSYTSGAQITGLTGGTTYYVQITALPPTGYVGAISAVSASAGVATVQLTAPSGVSLAYGTVAGSIAVTYTGSSNAPGGQTYSVTACTNLAMTTGCVTNANLASGGNLTGLAYAQGSPGTSYYVTVTANPSNGYLASSASAVAGPQNATSQIGTPGTPALAASTTTPGAITATFSASAGTAPTSYTAKACTNAAMTTGCVTQANYTSGAQLTGLTPGTSYYVAITAVPPTGFVSATSATSTSPATATTQLATPTITSVAPSTTTAGAVTISFTGASNAPGGQSYTATACTDAGMTLGCVTQAGYTSGAQFTGLTPGTSYYVTITAVASSGYLVATTAAVGPTLASIQLTAPTGVSLAYGTVAGSVAVTYTGSSNAPGGETYTVKACTNAGMTTGCVTNANLASGANLTGLAYAQGAAGTAYYVTVTANASSGYLASAASGTAGPQNATSLIGTPGTPSLASSITTAGAITATFSASSGVSPASYTATSCTNAAMTTGCVTQTNYTSGAQLTGLTQGTSYYVSITAVAPLGFVSATSGVSVSSAKATIQLTAPTGISLAYGTVAGSIAVTYTGSSNAPGGQTYTVTACTNAAMTTGCVTNANATSGANLTGLAYVQGAAGTAYYVTVTANPSASYLASAASGVAGPQNATSQIGAPGTPTLASSTTTAGAITATFTASSGVAPSSYTATSCTNAAMTIGCVTQTTYTSGAQLTGLTAGTSYFVTITAVPPVGFVTATSGVSASSAKATIQLATPTITAVAPSTTTSGALTISFTGSSNAPGGQSYTATACTNAAMTTGCVTQANYTTGLQMTGLAAATSYYVTITAVASSGYLAATTASVGPTLAAVQLTAPTGVSLADGTVAGSIAVTYTGSSNAPGGETYTVTACTNAAMTTGCVTNANLASGANLTGLAYAQGAAGTAYYVTVTANASSGYLVSAASSTAGPQNATSQVNAPGTPTLASSTTTAGAITATFAASTGVAPASYTATACTNAAMTTGCVTQTNYTSGAQLTGLAQGTSYFVTITAVPAAGYVAATSGVSASSAKATVQLTAPTGVSLAYGTVAGSIAVTYTGSSNAPGGETYTVTACTNAAMTTGCVTNANLASGANLTGLAYAQGAAGTAYYVTVTANASSGYLVSAASSTAGPQNATSQVNAPGTPTLASSTTTAGAITATFAASTGVAPASYTATACTNAAMTTGCVTQTNYTSGAQLTGLAQGTSYFVTITAVPAAGYVAATSGVSASSATATVALATPSTPVLGYGSVAGSITVTSTSSNAPGGETYTVKACTNFAMTTGCVTNASFTSGSTLSGLAYTPGVGGTPYYVTVVANPASGFVASAPSAVGGPQPDTSQLNAPGTPTVASSSTTAAAITATFSNSTGTAPASYTATACTNVAMTTGCVTQTAYTSGAQLTGLTAGTAYYVQVTAVPGAGFVSATSATSATSAAATTQLNAPTITAVASSSTTAGGLTITFSGSSNAPGGQSYTAKACTNAAMTTGCVTQAGYTSGTLVSGLTAGSNYYATITAAASSGYLASTSSAFGPTLATVQLTTPTINSVTPSTTTAGAVTISYTGSANAPGGQLYTAIACTNAAMTTGCVTQTSYASGAQLTGLTAGTGYYVTLTAVASSGYLAVTTASVGPTTATVQLTTPTGVSITYGTVAGSLDVTFTGSSNAPGGQAYTATACTNAAMTTGCVTGAITSGGNLTGLAYTPGTVGTNYYVTVTATASSGYLASATSAVAGPHADTSQLNAPTGLVTAPSTTTAGAVTATFTNSTGTAPASYTATSCTNAAMTTGCVTQTSYASGAQLTGLTAGTNYYVTITAVAPAGYVAATTSVSAATLATLQLTVPTGVSINYGTVAGSLAVTFTGSSNAPGGQAYTATACTNAAMTTACVTSAITSGANLTGLVYTPGTVGTNYYVTVTATASSGYLVSASSAVAGPHADTSQLNAPTGLATAPSTTTAGAVTATFTNSTGTAPASYTATACTNAAMTTGCVTQTSYASGAQLTGLTAGTNYYVTITAVAPAGYVAATTAVSAATLATVQLSAPSALSLNYGAAAGSIQITFTAPANAPGGQAYTATACTNAAMTTGCVTGAITSGGTLSGLVYTQGAAGTNYYVTVTATASSGYLSRRPPR